MKKQVLNISFNSRENQTNKKYLNVKNKINKAKQGLKAKKYSKKTKKKKRTTRDNTRGLALLQLMWMLLYL